MIVRSLAGDGREGSGRVAFQDHPDNGRIGRVRPTVLIGLLPVRLQRLGDLRRRLCRPARQEVGQTARQDGCRLVGAHPAQTLQRVLLRRSFDDLGQGSDVVGDRETDDLLGGLLDRHAGIADRMA